MMNKLRSVTSFDSKEVIATRSDPAWKESPQTPAAQLSSPRSPAETRRRGAFTLIELMVVVVITGIVVAMILPAMKGTYEDALLRSAGRKIADAVNLANSRAISRGTVQWLHIDATKGRYSMHEKQLGTGSSRGQVDLVPVRDLPGSTGSFDPRIAVSIRKQAEPPNDNSEPTAPLLASTTAAQNSGSDAITFFPDGTADPAQILLRDREGFELGLRIHPTTSRVRIYNLGNRSLSIATPGDQAQ